MLTYDKKCKRCSGRGRIRYVSGEWLRECRLKAGVSMIDLAAEMGHSRQYLFDMEIGRRTVSERTGERYVEAVKRVIKRRMGR